MYLERANKISFPRSLDFNALSYIVNVFLKYNLITILATRLCGKERIADSNLLSLAQISAGEIRVRIYGANLITAFSSIRVVTPKLAGELL